MPTLWIGGTLLLLPHAPWVTLLGYHAMCLWGARRTPMAWGRVPLPAWLGLAAMAAGSVWIFRLPGQPHGLPMAGAQTFLAYWPGGFFSYVAYTLTVNSYCEERYWRGAVPAQYAGWSDAQQGAAFGLHHVVANTIVFGWLSAPIAFAYTAFGGWLGRKASRRLEGLGFVMLGHSLLNALSFAWLYTKLR